MGEIMSGGATPSQIAGFLMALHAKGETVEEMRGLADEMLAHATRIQAPELSLDVVGTGGDRAQTVNISTMAAMVCAAAGVSVVKHGNRAASSRSGSADVLEALGIDLTLPAARVEALAHEVGITFCFALVALVALVATAAFAQEPPMKSSSRTKPPAVAPIVVGLVRYEQDLALPVQPALRAPPVPSTSRSARQWPGTWPPRSSARPPPPA